MDNTKLHLATSEILDALGEAGYLREIDIEEPDRFARMQNVIRPLVRKIVEEESRFPPGNG